MVKYHLIDDIYAEDEYGSHILHSLEKAQNFNRWMAEAIAPHVGARVLEIGAGIGNITTWLLPRDFYLASDINPNYLDYLKNLALGKPYLHVDRIDLEDPRCFAPWLGPFDTVVCLNVLEHVRDPLIALRNMHSALAPGGRVVLYVPQGQSLYSSLDEVLGHRCRYEKPVLAEELRATGFELESMRDFNHLAIPGWYVNGKLFKRRHFSRFQLKIFNLMVPVVRRIDGLIPGKGLGIIAVGAQACRGLKRWTRRARRPGRRRPRSSSPSWPAAAAARAVRSTRSHPGNVVVVVIDTLRRDHLATYGYAAGPAPFLASWRGRARPSTASPRRPGPSRPPRRC